MRVLFFGTYDKRVHPRVEVLQEGFAALGDEVVECNVPLGLDTAWRVRILRRPWLAPVLVLRIALAWVRLWWRSRGAAAVDAVVVGYLGHFDVHLARRRFPRVPIALDHLVSMADTAADRGASGSLVLRGLAGVDRRALEAATMPFVDTEEHLELLPPHVRAFAAVVAVGAPAAWFSPPLPAEDRQLHVVFFGLYTPLQGAPTIGGAIALLHDAGAPVRFTMVGRGQELAETRRRAGSQPPVTWLDWVEGKRLPGLVARHQVCLGIFGTGPKARRVVPNKVFQGAAAGCAVVTADTAPQRAALSGAAIFVPPGDPDALADVLAGLAADPDRLREAQQSAFARAEERFRPERVVAPLRARLTAR